MTPEREKLIRHIWEEESHRFSWAGGRTAVFFPLPQRIDIREREDILRPVAMPRLAFEIDRFFVDGRRAARITCEGIELSFQVEPA